MINTGDDGQIGNREERGCCYGGGDLADLIALRCCCCWWCRYHCLWYKQLTPAEKAKRAEEEAEKKRIQDDIDQVSGEVLPGEGGLGAMENVDPFSHVIIISTHSIFLSH